MNQTLQFIAGAATAVALIFGGLAVSEARAEALWKRTQYWDIKGDYSGYCRAESVFPSGMIVNIGLENGEGWKLSLYQSKSIPMEVGKQHTIDVTLTGKTTNNTYTLTGIAFDQHGIKFPNLVGRFVADFSYAPSIKIGDWGLFSLKGSMEAIEETMNCFKALTGAGAYAATPTRRA